MEIYNHNSYLGKSCLFLTRTGDSLTVTTRNIPSGYDLHMCYSTMSCNTVKTNKSKRGRKEFCSRRSIQSVQPNQTYQFSLDLPWKWDRRPYAHFHRDLSGTYKVRAELRYHKGLVAHVGKGTRTKYTSNIVTITVEE